MWRYALPGVAIVGAVIALFAGALTLTGNQTTAPPPRAVSDQSLGTTGRVPDAPIAKPPPDAGTRNPIDTRLPPPPDLDAAQKAATEASQALAAIQREREAERALMAKQAQPGTAAPAPPPPPAQNSDTAERQTRLQELDQQIAQRNEKLAAVKQRINQARQSLAGLQQQQDAERAVLNKLKTQDEPALTAERDKLQSQIADLTSQVTQQKQALDATRAGVTQAQQALAAVHKQEARIDSARRSPGADEPSGSGSFSTVQSIVEGLRKSARSRDSPPPPPPQASGPAIRHSASAGAELPWRSLMAARQAIATGDPGLAQSLLASSQRALNADPDAAGGFAAAQVAEAVTLLDAGAPVRAMHYLDLAIANVSRMPQAAASPAEQP